MLTIGEVAARVGIQPSAIRYYEQLGLVPAAQRKAGKRVYGADMLDRLALIQLAQGAGFALAEIRDLFAEIESRRPAAAVWKRRAAAKRADLNAQIRRATRMKHVLSILATCNCDSVMECGRVLNAMRERLELGRVPSASRRNAGNQPEEPSSKPARGTVVEKSR